MSEKKCLGFYSYMGGKKDYQRLHGLDTFPCVPVSEHEKICDEKFEAGYEAGKKVKIKNNEIEKQVKEQIKDIAENTLMYIHKEKVRKAIETPVENMRELLKKKKFKATVQFFDKPDEIKEFTEEQKDACLLIIACLESKQKEELGLNKPESDSVESLVKKRAVGLK